MPGTEHEWLIDVFRAAPSLLAALLQSLGFQVPDEWKVTENNVGNLVPRERRVDLLLVAPDQTRLVVEVQTQPDNGKPVIWASYLGAALQGGPALLVVITADPKTAAWAAGPFVLGPSLVLKPIVLGPHNVPVIIEPADTPVALVVLSAIVHQKHPEAQKIAQNAVTALRDPTRNSSLDLERREDYAELLGQYLGADLLEGAIMNAGIELSEFIKRRMQEGEAIGKAQGEAIGRAAVLKKQLTLRFGAEAADAVGERLATADVATLDLWAERILSAATLDAVFAP